MKMGRLKQIYFALVSILLLAACNTIVNEQAGVDEIASTPVEANASATTTDNLLAHNEPVEIERAADVPPLPFPDNPDPALCGIPQPWNSDAPAYLSGLYEGELIQPIVFLYDSHLRREVVAEAPHGTEVKILLSQSNPELDYFLVKVIGAETPNEGWVPAPFVSFDPPPQS